jgi:hypothetical protein
MAAFSSQAVTRFVLNPAQQPDDGQQHHDDRGHVAHKDRGDHGYDLGSQPGPSINFPFVCLAADNSEASSMDPRKRQTATATPSEPGVFPWEHIPWTSAGCAMAYLGLRHCTSPLSASTPTCAFIPKYHWFPAANAILYG